MLRPKHLQSPKYRLDKTIPLGQHHYLFDMTCSGQGILAVSDAFYHSIDKQQIFLILQLDFILHIKMKVQTNQSSYSEQMIRFFNMIVNIEPILRSGQAQ